MKTDEELWKEAADEALKKTRRKMKKHKLDFDYLLERIKYLCEATKPISCIKGKDADGGTVDFIDVPDNAAIAKGVDLALTIGDHYPCKKVNMKISGKIITSEITPEEREMLLQVTEEIARREKERIHAGTGGE